jgi:hypothetical protein
MKAGIVGGEAFAVDASMIVAAHFQSPPSSLASLAQFGAPPERLEPR